MRYGIDANVLIYLLDPESEWHDQCLQLFKSAEKGHCQVIASELLVAELLSLQSLRVADIKRIQRAVQNLPLRLRPIAKMELLSAAKLRREFRIGLADAIHISTAAIAGAEQFVTNDLKLTRRRLPKIKCVLPDSVSFS